MLPKKEEKKVFLFHQLVGPEEPISGSVLNECPPKSLCGNLVPGVMERQAGPLGHA